MSHIPQICEPVSQNLKLYCGKVTDETFNFCDYPQYELPFWRKLHQSLSISLCYPFYHVQLLNPFVILKSHIYHACHVFLSGQLIGKDDVAVPTHLFKVILARRTPSSDTLALGAFVVPNHPIGFDHSLAEYGVSLSDLERMSGLSFFPEVDPTLTLGNLCELDSCHLMDFKEFTLYITGRKVGGARSSEKLEKTMAELKEMGIVPDDYLLKLYQRKKEELRQKETPEGKMGN